MENVGTRQSSDRPERSDRVWNGSRMGRQEKSVKSEEGHAPREHVSKNLRGLVGDAIKLVDLQLQLFTVDVQDFWSQAKIGLALVVFASLTLVCGLIVLFFGLSAFLESQLNWSEHAAFFTVGIAGIAVAGGLLYWAARRITYSAEKLTRSKEELSNNLNWFRDAFSDDD